MLLFTWNLHKNEEALRLALAHLPRSGYSFVASFQELPAPWATTTAARDATKRLVGDRVRCLGVTSAAAPHKHGRVGLFCSPNIAAVSPDVQRDPRQRMAIISITGARIEPLIVIGYHGESRQDAPTDGERGRIGAQTRGEVDKHWTTEPLIMLGDFNASPFDAEVCGSDGLFAVRDRTETFVERASRTVPLGAKQRPLYNPMWSLLPESTTRPAGTFVHDPRLMLRWRLYDQIVVSAELMHHVRGAPEILFEIAGRTLLTTKGHPESAISDHLPVQVRIAI